MSAFPVAEVTVLEDRAAVTRRGSFAAVAGQQRVVIEGVAPVLVDKTLTATATGARVLDVRCERFVAPWREPGAGEAESAATLRAEYRKLGAARDAVTGRAAAAHAEIEALVAIGESALADLAAGAARGVGIDDAVARLAELDTAETAARARWVAADAGSQDLSAQLARLGDRLARAEAEAGEEAARLVIDLVADQASEATVTVTYIVPGAAWRPYHRAELARDGAQVAWQVTACVWQATGEDWTDAEVQCSLERPSLGVEPPDLADDVVSTRKKPDTVIVEAREDEQETTGLGQGGAPQVPGIDDGGLGVRLSAGRVRVRADGTPHRLPLASFTAPAKLALVAIPLRSPYAHLRARFSNAGAAPLLAGPIDLIMGSGYVGRGELGFVAPNEQVDIGFGPEADVRVHRTEERERDDAGLLGNWNVQTVRVAVRLSNLGGSARSVLVTERVPVSEVEQVQIQTSPANAYLLAEHDDDDAGVEQITARAIDELGLVTWTVELPPFGRRAVALEYKIKSQRKVVGA